MSLMNHKTNESGITLVELLAAVVIATFIGLIAIGILVNGFKTYERVKIEGELRDRADLIMAEMFGDMFTLKETDIDREFLPEQGTNNYYLELNNGSKIGFYNGQVYLLTGQLNAFQDGTVQLSPQSKIIKQNDGQYQISLTLYHSSFDQSLTTKSEIGIIKELEENN